MRDRSTGDSEVLDTEQVQVSADLSVVDELDVAEHSAEFLVRSGDRVRRLTRTWEPILSRAVLADACRVVG